MISGLIHVARSADPAAIECLADTLSALVAGARAARREWLLCLEPGDIPAEGWIRSLDRFVGTARPDMALGRMRRAYGALPARIAARGESVVGARGPRAGDVVRRERVLAGLPFSPRLKVRMLTARLDRA